MKIIKMLFMNWIMMEINNKWKQAKKLPENPGGIQIEIGRAHV